MVERQITREQVDRFNEELNRRLEESSKGVRISERMKIDNSRFRAELDSIVVRSKAVKDDLRELDRKIIEAKRANRKANIFMRLAGVFHKP